MIEINLFVCFVKVYAAFQAGKLCERRRRLVLRECIQNYFLKMRATQRLWHQPPYKPIPSKTPGLTSDNVNPEPTGTRSRKILSGEKLLSAALNFRETG
jgi:hypothetical protein